VQWQRLTEGERRDIAHGDFSTLSANDFQKEIRAIEEINANSPFPESLHTVAFETPTVRIELDSSVIARLAGILRRAGKAQFEDKLPMDEAVVAFFEPGMLLFKNAAGVLLLKAKLQHVTRIRSMAIQVGSRSGQGMNLQRSSPSRKRK
jgi:hypothetical protein